MARDVETLIVKLEARITDFEKKMTQAERRARTASNSVASAFDTMNRRVATGLRTLGVGLGVLAVERFVKSTIDAGSSISDLSQRLGISAEKFQELAFAANQTAATTDDFVAGFRGMAQFLRGVATGSKEQVAVLKSLGLTFDDLKKKAPADVFKILLDRIGKIQNPTQRAATLMQVLGRNGAALGALSLIGAAGMGELEQKARDTGNVMSNQTVDALDKAGDKLGQFGGAVTTLAGNIVAPLLPAIEAMASAVQDPGFQGALKNIADLLANIIKAITEHPEILGILGGAAIGGKIGGLPGAVVGGVGGAVGVNPGIFTNPGGVRELPEFGRSMLPPSGIAPPEELTRSMNPASAARAAEAEAAAVKDVAAAATAATPPVNAAAAANRGVVDSIDDLLKNFPDLLDDITNWNDLTDAQADKAAEVAKNLAFDAEQLRRTAREQAAYTAVQQAGVDVTSQIGGAIAAQARANYDLQQSIQGNIDRLDDYRDTAREVFGTVLDGIRANQSGAEILSNVLAQLAQRIGSASLDKLVDALLGAKGGSSGGLLGDLLTGFLSSVFGGRRAGGGPVLPGRLYRVNETGASGEWFIPSVPGRITSAAAAASNFGAEGPRTTRHLVELAMTPEFDGRVRRVSGPQSQEISIRTIQQAGKQQARQQELTQ